MPAGWARSAPPSRPKRPAWIPPQAWRNCIVASNAAGFWRRCCQRLALPALAPVAITALASLCIGQAWLLWQQPAPADQLRWRSVPGAVAPPASLRVQFLPTASMAQVAAALEQAQAGIVAGPLPDHGYLLDAADPPAALQSLRASGVVAAASLTSTPGAP